MTKTTATLLAWAIVLGSVNPAFAAGNFTAKSGPVSMPGALPGVGAQIPTLPTSLIPAIGLPGGINAGVIEHQAAGIGATAQANTATSGVKVSAAAAANGAKASQASMGANGQVPVAGAGVSAAASAEENIAAAAAAESKSGIRTIIGNLANAIVSKLTGSKIFDAAGNKAAPMGALGIRPLPSQSLPQGLDLGNAPTTPAPKSVGGIELNAFDPNGPKTSGLFGIGQKVIAVKANDASAIETAVRALVDADAASYGVSSAELKTHTVVVEQGLDKNTSYVVFKQVRNSKDPDGSVRAVEVHGSQLSFTIKEIKGQTVVMAPEGKIYPNITAKTDAILDDAGLKKAAEAKLPPVPQNATLELSFIERKIIFHDGAWKTVNLHAVEYEVNGRPQAVGIMLAVDVTTGDMFAWDGRHGFIEAGNTDSNAQAPEATATGTVNANAEKDDHRQNDQAVLTSLTLPHLDATVNGKAVRTDREGKFSSSIAGTSGDFKATLSGSWAVINDRARKPVSISATINAGDNTITANPTATDEGTVGQLNTYIWMTRIHDWWSDRLGKDKRIDKKVPGNTNIDDECNAYYTPGRPSLNFYKSSRNCSDTHRPGVIAHEYGHFVHDMIGGGINNGGMSEGWGDIGSMYLLGTPIIGEGFLKKRNPSWIRHGENNYQYGEHDEVHDQGQAWMGFAWKLRKSLIAQLGETAGTAAAEALIIPVLFVNPSDIPSAMAQVLLNATDKNGNVVHEAEIRAAAKAHGIDLPKNAGGFASSLWNGIINAFRGGVSVSEKSGIMAPNRMNLAAAPAPKKLTVSATKSKAEEIKAKIDAAYGYRSGEHGELSMQLQQADGVFGTTFEIELNGSQEAVDYMTEQIKRLAK